MNVLGIDVGIKNLGLCIVSIKDDIYNIICIKLDISNINYNLLENIYNMYKLDKMNTILIEQQYNGKNNLIYYGYLMCFFQSKNKKIISVKPPSFGLNVNKYKNRKQYSINVLNTLINNCNNVKYINRYSKIDDIADALCIVLKYIKFNISDNKNINSIQIL